MLILRLSLIMAVNVVLGVHGSGIQSESNTTSSNVEIGPLSKNGEGVFDSEWKIGDITLNQTSSFSFKAINPGGGNPPDALVLAQTSAGPSEPITEENTSWVVQLQSKNPRGFDRNLC